MDPIVEQVVYDSVSDIDATKETWCVRVKVILLWKQHFKNNPNQVSSLDMILMDHQGNKIQATIKRNLISSFESLLEEGSVRVISNFGVASNTGNYMLVRHGCKINFYKTTKVQISPDFVEGVDPYEFPSFSDLLNKNLDTRVAFDVVGLVVSTDAMRVTSENGKESRFMTLQLQDLTGRKIACALWDSFALMLNKYISENQAVDSPVVILLRMAKLKEWAGMPQLSNCLFGSRLHINDDIAPILSFKESLNAVDANEDSSTKVTQLNADTVVANPEDYYLGFQIITIDEIAEHTKEIGVTIIGTIIGFQVEEGWYYFACRNCGIIVTRNDVDVGREPFNCEKCGDVSDVFGKVRVVVRVQDPTGSSSFVFFDRLISKLIHRNNDWLMDKIAKDQGRQIFPDELNLLLNRKFVFKIQISRFNLQTSYSAYTVHKCNDDERVIEKVFKHSPAYELENPQDDGTPTKDANKQKEHVSDVGDNTNVIDLDATPTTSVGKRPIEMVNNSPFDCSSSKGPAPADALKIPKMEKLG